jgi:hypothetical protein
MTIELRKEAVRRKDGPLLRLHHDGVSARKIACELGVARSTIRDNLKRAVAAGLTWPLAADLTDDVLEQRLFSCARVRRGIRRKPEPDWSLLARELKRPGVSAAAFTSPTNDSRPPDDPGNLRGSIGLLGRRQCRFL